MPSIVGPSWSALDIRFDVACLQFKLCLELVLEDLCQRAPNAVVALVAHIQRLSWRTIGGCEDVGVLSALEGAARAVVETPCADGILCPWLEDSDHLIACRIELEGQKALRCELEFVIELHMVECAAYWPYLAYKLIPLGVAREPNGRLVDCVGAASGQFIYIYVKRGTFSRPHTHLGRRGYRS